jgi:hypothetical protein
VRRQLVSLRVSLRAACDPRRGRKVRRARVFGDGRLVAELDPRPKVAGGSTYGSLTVVISRPICAMQEVGRNVGNGSCYSENTQGSGSVSVAAQPSCPANVFWKRWIASASSAKRII